MARPASRHPTELELAILKVLWQRGPLPAKDVREALAPARDLAYTSGMTVMNIMRAQGYLGRRKAGANYLYHPRVTEKATLRSMLKDLVTRAFDGSAAAVVVNLLEPADLDTAEIERIRRMLKDRAGGARS